MDHASADTSSTKRALLSLLTINDVYEFETVDGVGGFGPTATWINQERARAARKGGHSLFFVCGDFMSASRLGNVHKGAHMVHLFNEMGVDYVVFGNHEFDFGNEVLRTRIKESKFKWLGTNVLTPEGKPFGGSSWIDVREFPFVPSASGSNSGGVLRVGLFGVCTLATPNLSFPDADVTFAPVIACAQAAVKCLVEEHKVDVIVAVTHISLPQDKELAAKVPEIDVIIGGHDHVPYCIFEHKVFIMKCGQNAEYLGRIDLAFTPAANGAREPKGLVSLDWKVKANRGIAPDPRIEDIIRSYTAAHDEALRQPIATVATVLDSTQTRAKESTMANFVADALCETFDAELGIINGGFIRGNRVYEPGYAFTLGDVEREFPFPKRPVVVEILGKDILEALEAGVRAVEEKAGFFLHLSKGWSYSFDPRKPPGQRVERVEWRGAALELERTYRVVITEYMRGGGDGFESLKRGTVVKGSDNKISEILTRYITAKQQLAPVLEGRVVYVH